MKRSFILPVLFSFFGIILLTSCTGGTPNRAPVRLYGASDGEGSGGVHAVVRGDTLYSISQRYKIAMRDIAIDNRLSAPFRLNEGQRLKLPPPQKYRVRGGDSLHAVSRLFNVNRSEIAQLNNLQPPYVIRPGQVLRLPSAAKKAEEARILAEAARAVKPERGQAQEREQERAASPVRTPVSSVRTAQAGQVEPAPKVKAKTKAIKQAKAKITAKTPKRASSKFMRPVQGRIISSYGPKKNGLHNDGINIKAPKGAAVRAAENGVVVYAGSELKGSGNLVLIRHQGRWMTAYAHMDTLSIKRGDVIKRGQTIGTVGATGSVDTPQLHFEVRRGTEAINPSVYLEG